MPNWWQVTAQRILPTWLCMYLYIYMYILTCIFGGVCVRICIHMYPLVAEDGGKNPADVATYVYACIHICIYMLVCVHMCTFWWRETAPTILLIWRCGEVCWCVFCVLHCVAMCCSLLRWVAVRYSVMQYIYIHIYI